MIPEPNGRSLFFCPWSMAPTRVTKNKPIRRATRADYFLNDLDVIDFATKTALCTAMGIQDATGSSQIHYPKSVRGKSLSQRTPDFRVSF
jgi:hypothetical protein